MVFDQSDKYVHAKFRNWVSLVFDFLGVFFYAEPNQLCVSKNPIIQYQLITFVIAVGI